MTKDKRSFFERLTGSVRIDEDMMNVGEERQLKIEGGRKNSAPFKSDASTEQMSEEGQLAVDVHQTPTEIIIKTMVAGVRPEDLDISITRDMVTIKGRREGERMVQEEDYFHKELYWGSFSRTVMLPNEIEVEEAEASEKHGLLIVRLPKINKNRETKIKVKPLT